MNKTALTLLPLLSFLPLFGAEAALDTASHIWDTNLTITTANQSQESIRNTTADITVLSSADFAENGDQTAAQALSRVAGISVTGNGGYGQPSTIFMRGQSSGAILVLLDGMRLNDPSTTDGRAMIENLLTENIAQIEVIKGGSSSIWGSDASAGVINIISKKPAKKGFHGDMQLQGGSYNTKGANTTLSYGGEQLSAHLFGSFLESDSFSALAPRDAENDPYKNTTLNFKLGYDLDTRNALSFNYYLVDALGEYDDAYSALLADDGYTRYTSFQENYQLQYRFNSDQFESINKANQGNFRRDYFTNSYGEAENQYRSTIQEFASVNSYKYDEGKATLGVEAKDIDGMNSYLSSYPSQPSQSAYQNRAIFLSNYYRFAANTLIETNLRYDDFDAFENETTYKIGLKQDFDAFKGLSARANYYTSYDAPSAYQLANAALGELLRPSYSKGFDIALAFEDLLSVSYFDTSVENPIEYDMGNFGYYNVGGEELFSGIEVGSRYRLASLGVALGANWTHLITYESHDTTALSNRAEDILNLSVDYFTANNLHFNITGQYIGDRVDVSTEETGNYTLWHLNFDTKINKDFKLYINAKNIFDEEYESVYGYATEGRSVYGKIIYSF